MTKGQQCHIGHESKMTTNTRPHMAKWVELNKKKFLRQEERAECRRLREIAILKGEL